MSATLDADVNIILNSQDHASEVVEAATKRINKSVGGMRAETRALNGAFEMQHRTLVRSARSMQSVASMAQRAVSIFNSWQLIQIRQNQLIDRRIDLEKELAEATASGDFERAADVQKELNRLQEEQNKLLTDQIGLWIIAGSVALGQVGKIVRSLPTVTRGFRKLFGQGTTASTGTGTATTTAPRTTGKLGNLGKFAGRFGGPIAAAVSLASMLGEQQAGGSMINPATGQEEFTELPTGLEAIKDILFKTDSSKKIAINIKVENEQQSAEVDLDTGQVTYGGP